MSRWNRPRSADTPDGIRKIRQALAEAEAVVIGAGAGVSASAGMDYSGERFLEFFGDFREKYQFEDMYAGGFYPYPSPEESWAFWSRNIYINRYMKAPKPVCESLLELVEGKEYFVITTNVDHQFQKAGIDKSHLFYTQGDYGLWQCSQPCHRRTYSNKSRVVKMLLAQGFLFGETGELLTPKKETGGQPAAQQDPGAGPAPQQETDFTRISMRVPSDLIPYCPVCGEPMTMNLRSDDTFVEDAGWHAAQKNYEDFLNAHRDGKILFLDVGTGFNTPGIFKYPFWRMTYENPDAVYVCLNYGEAFAPKEIEDRSVCINGDLGEILDRIRKYPGART